MTSGDNPHQQPTTHMQALSYQSRRSRLMADERVMTVPWLAGINMQDKVSLQTRCILTE